MPTHAELLNTTATRFAKNAREILKIELDGSLKSLMVVCLVLQQYNKYYMRAEAAKDPELEKYALHLGAEATCYVIEVLVQHMKVDLTVARDGKYGIVVEGVAIPVTDLIIEEIKTGKPNSIMIVKQVGGIQVRNTKAQEMDAGNVEVEARASAALAAQEMRTMFSQEPDYSPASLALVDLALQRLRSLAAMFPESTNDLVKASSEQYGAYIGEVMTKHLNGKWCKVQVQEAVHNAVEIGAIYSMPYSLVEAVLAGKVLYMGEKSAASAVDFLVITEERVRASAPFGLFRNLDAPGEVLKRIKLFAEEAARLATQSYGITLDYTLFSLEALDALIAKQRKKLEDERSMMTENDFEEQRAFAILPLGAYLGETILRAHGGSWEDSEPWPLLRQRFMRFDPIMVARAFLRGEMATATEKTMAANAQQYYQKIRPALADAVSEKLYGSAGNEEILLSQMGPTRELNAKILALAETCVVFSYAEYNVELDFTQSSLRDVDRLLEQFHKNTEEEIKAKPVLDRINLINLYGAYAGEVFRRSIGGVWANDASGSFPAGPPVPHLLLDGQRIFVVTKVRKFLQNGIGDSLAFMFQAIRTMSEQGFTGYSHEPQDTAPVPAGSSVAVEPESSLAEKIKVHGEGVQKPADVVQVASPGSPAEIRVVRSPESNSQASEPPGTYDLGGPKAYELKQQLQQGDLSGLRQFLASARQNEDWQDRSFIMGCVAPSMLPKTIDEACTAEPNAADLRMLRGFYLVDLAAKQRGSRTADKTSEKQFANALKCIMAALNNLEKAITFDPRDPGVHLVIMRAALSFTDHHPRLRQAYQDATHLVSDLVPAHFGMVNARSQKWGGSAEESLQIARAAVAKARPGSDMAACLFYAHILAWQYHRVFDKDEKRAKDYLSRRDVVKELNGAFDLWIAPPYEPSRSSILYLHHAAYWYYQTQDRVRLKQALSRTNKVFYDMAWSFASGAQPTYSQAMEQIAQEVENFPKDSGSSKPESRGLSGLLRFFKK